MQEKIDKFVDFMRSVGCAPQKASDISPSEQFQYFRIESDKKDNRGGYFFTIENDGFAHGTVINFKTGDKGSWHSKKSVDYSQSERDAAKERVAAANKIREELSKQNQDRAAIEAREFFDNLAPCTEHPYLISKSVLPFNARIDGKDMIIPMYATDGSLYAYQRITPQGGKWYLQGARKNGLYCPLSSGSPVTDTIIICEGFATGASIRMACPDIPVIVAFDAYNIIYVAEALRKKYKESKIIIAADNDESGTGQKRAAQAATKIGGFVAMPDIVGKDFNDIHKEHGLDAVKPLLAGVLHAPMQAVRGQGEQSPPIDPPHPATDTSIPWQQQEDLIPFNVVEHQHNSPPFDDNKLNKALLWRKQPNEIEKGKLEPNSLHNILVFLRHKKKYMDLFRYDRFAGRVILHREPFWQDEKDKFKVREIRDNDTSYLTAHMERDGLSPSGAKVREAIEVVAHENWINPPLEYFNSLTWDRKPRLGTWLKTYLGADGDRDYLSAVGMAWLIAGVARIYDPGCKAENMLVLEGNQGLLKSTALSVLANVGRGADEESYFCDTLGFDQINDKDTVLKLKGKLIVEIPDLAGLGNREIEAVKAWMSIQHDEIRVPYGREMMKFPRQFILAGSTNESHWLKDQTGNRRFWPVKCGQILIDALKADREQIWAEAVHLYKNKSIWWIGRDNPVWIKAETEQSLRLQEDIWFQPVEKYVDCMEFVTVREILESFKIETKDQTSKHQKQVIDILKRLKFVSKQKRLGGKIMTGWSRLEENIIEPEFTEISF